ncbi:TolC family protein [Flavobacterium sp. ZB4R12]|uniref:TolC family protein n=1 Tax=Flavobacterium sp. ZB4R12 TaxID=3398732 RepID=UPI003AADA48B
MVHTLNPASWVKNQLENNQNQQIGMQLNVPVFNGFRNNKKISASKIESDKVKLVFEQEKQQLDKQIVLEEQNKKNYLQLQNKLIEKLRYAKASLTTTQAKFKSGKVEAILYSTVKNQLLTAEYEVLKNNLQLQYVNLKINLLKNNIL